LSVSKFHTFDASRLPGTKKNTREMAEFDPEAYLEAKLQSEASGPAIPPPPPLPAGEEERPRDRDDGDRDRRRRSRSRDRDRRRSRSRDRDRDRRRDDRGSRRDRSPRRDARPRYDENYKPEVREGGYGGGDGGRGGDRPRHGRDPGGDLSPPPAPFLSSLACLLFFRALLKH
jgi:hypothetical protein